MPRNTFYLVSDGHPTAPRFLDGFRQDDTPVWITDLQKIDPFADEGTALEESKRVGSRAPNREVVPCRLDNKAWLRLVKNGRIVRPKRIRKI